MHGMVLEHLAREPKGFCNDSIRHQIAQVFVYDIDTTTGNAACNCPVKCLTGSQSFFGLFAFRDIYDRADQANRQGSILVNCLPTYIYPAQGAIRANDALFYIELL